MSTFQRIGELSGLIGIPPSTLRFYETRGIADPIKESENQYRLYTPNDSCRFLITKLLRSFGCSLEEASRIVTEGGIQETLGLLEEKEVSLDEQIRTLTFIRENLREYRRTISETAALEDSIRISERKGFYRFSSIEEGEIIKKRQLREFASLWMERLPFLHYSMKLPVHEHCTLNASEVSWGFSMDEDYILREGLTVPPEAEYFPPSKVAVACLIRDSAGFLEPEDIERIKWFLEGSPHQLNGPVTGNYLMIFHSEGRDRYLYQISCKII